jgi:hypothetical protein
MARKTTADILAEDYGKHDLLKDGTYFGLGEAAATPFVVQISPNPNDATPRVVQVGDLFTVVVGIERSDAKDAGFKPFRPLPEGVLGWVRTTANTALIEELSHVLYDMDTDRQLFTFRAIGDGTASIEFSYNYVEKNASTGELEVKTKKTSPITQVIKKATATVGSGTPGVELRAVRTPFSKYQAGEAFKADFMFTNSPVDTTKIKVVTTSGLSHTGTPAASGSVVTSQFVVNTDAVTGTVETITVYYGGTAKMAKVLIYDATASASPIWGFSEDAGAGIAVAGPAVAGAGAAAGPAVASLDDGAATPAAASLDDGAAEAAATPAASESKSSKKSKAVAD